jgi:hypothetical protein
LGPWRKILSELQTGPQCTIHMSLRLYRKPPRVSSNRTHGPSPNGTVVAEEERGGGAYRWRDCSSEVVEGVRKVLRVTAMCRSPLGMVGVGRSTCADGGARRRRGVRPNQGTIGQ